MERGGEVIRAIWEENLFFREVISDKLANERKTTVFLISVDYIIICRNVRLLITQMINHGAHFPQAILSLEEFQSLAGDYKKSFAIIRPPPCQTLFRLSSYEISRFLVFFFLSRVQQN